jgi:hypothetical protein
MRPISRADLSSIGRSGMDCWSRNGKVNSAARLAQAKPQLIEFFVAARIERC